MGDEEDVGKEEQRGEKDGVGKIKYFIQISRIWLLHL